jgi:hypothetical protein
MTMTHTPTPITAKQTDFLRTLLTEREIDAGIRETLLENLYLLTARSASDKIAWALKLPRRAAVKSALETSWHASPEVPAGYYALEVPGGEETDGEPVLRFYRVDRPTEGKWAGYTFVKVQASDEFYPVRGHGRTAILTLIAADIEEAGARYGREIGKCWRCHRTLTSDWRNRGIGPECSKKDF